MGEYCCHGQSFSLFVDARLTPSTGNTADRPGARRQLPQPRFTRIMSDTRNELAFANTTVIAYGTTKEIGRPRLIFADMQYQLCSKLLLHTAKIQHFSFLVSCDSGVVFTSVIQLCEQ